MGGESMAHEGRAGDRGWVGRWKDGRPLSGPAGLSPSLSPKPALWVLHLVSGPLHPRPLLHSPLPSPGPGVPAWVHLCGAWGRGQAVTVGTRPRRAAVTHVPVTAALQGLPCPMHSPSSPGHQRFCPLGVTAPAAPLLSPHPPLVSPGKFQRLQNYGEGGAGRTNWHGALLCAGPSLQRGSVGPMDLLPQSTRIPQGRGGRGGAGLRGTWGWRRLLRVTGWQRQLWDF